ncbi:hypothetical protein I3843_03G097100 [Carya illinoinensis]|nr:hypothetical protein I3843_03G097100 [Carya illinoinensis]
MLENFLSSRFWRQKKIIVEGAQYHYEARWADQWAWVTSWATNLRSHENLIHPQSPVHLKHRENNCLRILQVIVGE